MVVWYCKYGRRRFVFDGEEFSGGVVWSIYVVWYGGGTIPLFSTLDEGQSKPIYD